jgi:hypothetical protein
MRDFGGFLRCLNASAQQFNGRWIENLAGARKARLFHKTAPLKVRNAIDCAPMLLVCFTSLRARCRFIDDEAVIEIRHAPDVLREIPVYLFSI